MNVTDRHTDHGTATWIAIGEIACQRCPLKNWTKLKIKPMIS